MEKIKIIQIRSSIKRLKSQKRTLNALGLGRIGKEVLHEASPSILGMIKKVEHLVKVLKHDNKINK
ncbi:MAG: 50S ribosomal protein L30 [Flavobacteriaceae bacterium]|nr:50S ribosomal protein L30 [Flavobacteriaceae bacterium]|tara:strand:+ start:1892 stop:2089 length:198 start_codon:yes stop_codon:yes gene_type:complete